MKYLFDTCTVSDFVKGHQNTIQKTKACAPTEIGLSTVTIMEIESGILRLGDTKRAKDIKKITDEVILAVNKLNFDTETALKAALINSTLYNMGEPIGAYDILIAATALNHNLILVTSNTKEFKKIPELQIENWRT